MPHFVLIRPGSTDYDQQGRIQGTLDIPLDDQGAEQVQQVARSPSLIGDYGHLSGPVPECRANGQRHWRRRSM